MIKALLDFKREYNFNSENGDDVYVYRQNEEVCEVWFYYKDGTTDEVDCNISNIEQVYYGLLNRNLDYNKYALHYNDINL